MIVENVARKVIFLTSVISVYFLLSLSFSYAEESITECEECKATYIPGETKDVSALVITDKDCSFCDVGKPQDILKNNFAGIKFKVIDYRKKQAKNLIAKHKIQTLPSFLIDSLVKEEKNFEKIAFIFEGKNEKKLSLMKELTGICLYLKRKEIGKKIDLFLDLYEEGASEILDSLISFSKENEISLDLHFIISQEKKVGYPKEEIRVALAIQELYSNEFNDYVYRRIKDIVDCSWIDTAEKEGLNYKEIRGLMTSPGMDQLVSNNQELAEELMVGDGNVILINNNKIFKIFNIDKKELKSFFKGG
ncbi:MAG: hypothetical protein KAS05_03115 [Candidatus Omnitrophica bacterium]|nr:hypothetical protein [Candidatus Omnitrophota bacterium]